MPTAKSTSMATSSTTLLPTTQPIAAPTIVTTSLPSSAPTMQPTPLATAQPTTITMTTPNPDVHHPSTSAPGASSLLPDTTQGLDKESSSSIVVSGLELSAGPEL